MFVNDLPPQIERVKRIHGVPTCREAFHDVMKMYLMAKFAVPVVSCAVRDSTYRGAYRKWSEHTAHTVVDVERCVEKQLGKAALIVFLDLFTKSDELVVKPNKGATLYKKFVVSLGAAFIDSGLYPLRDWFRLPMREEAV